MDASTFEGRLRLRSPLTLLSTLAALLTAACGSDSPTDPSGLEISPSADADRGSSYESSRADIWIDYTALPRPNPARLGDAIAYLDADGDGDTDVFMGTGEFQSMDEVESEMYENQGGSFALDQGVFGGSPPPATHARKALAADFDGDGRLDVLVLDHGFDAQPFPGNQPKLVMQDAPAAFSWRRLTEQTGFHHGGSAADVDNDGDIDVFVGGFDPFFYVNDGTGAFAKVDDRFGGTIQKVFAAELIDVDGDGFVDLLVGAHERDGDRTSIYWGNSSGSYGNGLRTEIPALSPFGAVLDFDADDLDGDGDRDLVVNRTRDGDDGGGSGFYVGRVTQLLLHDGSRGFTDATSQIDDPGGDQDVWFPWIRIEDVEADGDLDVLPDDRSVGYYYLNDGSGGFTKTAIP